MATTTTSNPTYPLPTYIYKILPTPPPTPLPLVLPLNELDQKDGFIHFSTAAQIPTTASLFFASSPELHLLKVDTRKTLAAGGVYGWVEGLPGCPHLYGPQEGEWVHLGSENVVGSEVVKRGEGQTWEDVFRGLQAGEGWLVDE